MAVVRKFRNTRAAGSLTKSGLCVSLKIFFSGCRACGSRHNLFHCRTGSANVLFGQGRMHKKHQARLSQLARNRQPPPRPPPDGKCFLQINLAATATEARDAFGLNRFDNSIARPLRTKRLWTHKGIVLVIGMLNVSRRYRYTQAWQGRELAGQDLSVLAANGEPRGKFPQL